MSISHSLTRVVCAAAALYMLVAAAPTQAAIVGTFDPAFGPSIPNLGFRGQITLDVSGCGPGFQPNNGSPCSITLDPAGVQIYFYNATLNTPNNVLTTINLPGSFFPSNYVEDGIFDNTGLLTDLDTNDSALFDVSVTDTNPLAPISYSGNMLLYFNTPFEQIDPAFLVDCNSSGRLACTRESATNSIESLVTFTSVPEPGTVSLALLGLVVMAATARRARKASARQPTWH